MTPYGPQPWVQRHWDLRAAANFMLGGTGAGLVAVSALAAPSRVAIALGLALIAVGLTAVWLEIGRKLRAIHVFFNPRTSWMSRESLAALAVLALGAASLSTEEPWLLAATALAALVFVYCQARILREAKGIPAWRAPEIVPLVLSSAFAEGAASALLFERGPLVWSLLVLALIARGIAWDWFRRSLREPRSAAALHRPGKTLLLLGTALPLALSVLDSAAPLVAVAAVGAGWWLKFALVTRAAFNQGFALPHLPVRGAR
jgi:phenylacetyl-CoA:acceptor oxidoreductase subunit 2